MELIDLSSLACPGCHEPVDDGNEGFVHRDGSPLCRGETEPVEIEYDDGQAEPHVRAIADESALDAIAHILRDPQWATAMLEDIAELVTATGRSLEALPSSAATWVRH